MTLQRREFVIGTGALLSASLLTQACGRASSTPRSIQTATLDDPPIVEALRYGVTAPSAHNTQPWLVELVSENEALVFVDPARLLPATDPPARQIQISHGTFVELTAIAASQLGYRAEVELLPRGDTGIGSFDAKPTARIRLVPDASTTPDPLFEQLLERRTSRLPHEGPTVTQAELQQIVEPAKAGRMDVSLLAEGQLSDAIDIIVEAMTVEVNDFALYDETRHWFRFSKRAVREHGDGLSVNTAGLTGFAAGSANMFLSERNFHKEKNRERFLATFGETVRSSRGLLLITSPHNGTRDWIDAGRVYVRAQLAASAIGIRFHPVSQVLQEYPQMDALRARFESLVGVEPEAKVQMLVRLGRSALPGLSPRRPLGDMVVAG